MSNSKHYLWLIGFSVLAFWQVDQIAHWPKSIQSVLLYAPYLIAALGIFISIYLNRVQPIFLLLTIVVLNFAMAYFLPANTSKTDVLTVTAFYPLLAIFLPLNILLWILLPEKGVMSKPYVFSLLTVFILQGFAFYWLMDNLPMSTILTLAQPVGTSGVTLPMVPFLVTIGAWLLIVIRNAFQNTPKVLDNTVIFVLILLAYGLNQYVSFGVLAWLSVIASGLIILSLVFDSHQIAHTDQLTGMKGRRALFERFTGLGRKYAIAMMDIDHFKSFNDRYGHDVGDEALRLVAYQLARIPVGHPYRYGGEEFTVVFPSKTANEVKSVLDEMRIQISEVPLEVMEKGKKAETRVTVSFGLAEKTERSQTPEAVMKLADEALYVAKKAGRNCVKVYGEAAKKTSDKPAARKKAPAKK
ncbi:GGDEF domain-containing protein [Hydrogenovibrio kuenenii]|uniref:GGDEF domain-containing protein n=1 Tax=Hydrogenovibrio kuenenii TaxID=63658 RepID=UPI000463039F|nr:GGDEF domain-containing protein [Hydrogenovibrio kuenenii]